MNKQIIMTYLLDIQASLNLVPNLVALSLNMHYILNMWSKCMQYRHDKHLKHSSVVSNLFSLMSLYLFTFYSLSLTGNPSLYSSSLKTLSTYSKHFIIYFLETFYI